MGAVADDELAADDHVGDVGRGRGEDDRGGRGLRGDPGEADAAAGEVDEVGEAAAFDRPRLGPADRPLAVGGRRREQRRRVVIAALEPRQALVELIARASSKMSITACESLPTASRAPAARSAVAGPIPSARSRSVVGQRQTVAPAAPSSSRSRSLGWVTWIAVKRSSIAPASARTSVGVRP